MSSEQQRVSNVFISHWIGDGELATNLARLLKDKAGIRGYVAEEVKRLDDTITVKVRDELIASHCLVAILSHLGSQSPSVHQEIGFAISRDIPVILMREKGVQRDRLGVFVYGRDYFEYTQEDFNKVCDEIIGKLLQITVGSKTTIEERRLFEVIAREDSRKAHHLTFIRNKVKNIIDRANAQVKLFDEFIHDPNATLDRWNHIKNSKLVIDLIASYMPAIQSNFTVISDLMTHPGLPGRVDGELWATADVLAWIRKLDDPIGYDYDRMELINELKELRDWIARLNDSLRLIDEEMPARNREWGGGRGADSTHGSSAN